MRRLAATFAAVALAALVPAQEANDLAAIAERLRDERTRSSALFDLSQAGGPGAAAVLTAFLRAAAAGDDDAETFARALAELGTATAEVVERIVAIVPEHAEPLRSHLLRAVSNGVLLADAGVRNEALAAAHAWAEAGLCYSLAADQPTFAWHEYVRLVRRVRVADFGRDAEALRAAIEQLRWERRIVIRPGKGEKPPDDYHCAIDSFGAHGQRELLEAIGEFARTCPDAIDDVLDELACYLRYSPPQPPRLRTEHCAGIGEKAPNTMPGLKWPTQWRYDEWHFPCALAVFERSGKAEARELALRHLLHASDTTTRLRAIEAVRQWPGERLAFALDLAHCLDADTRDVVREALVTVLRAPVVTKTARGRLQRIADGPDRELAALARRALR
jgi:hypothetical protein